jgi:hypothetical protein
VIIDESAKLDFVLVFLEEKDDTRKITQAIAIGKKLFVGEN